MTQPRVRDRIFDALSNVGVSRPWLVLGLAAVLVVAGLSFVPFLGISTSRDGLVSRDNEYQANMMSFLDRFEATDIPLVVISGGSAEQRRNVSDALAVELETDPMLAGRVLGRAGPRQMAELLFLRDPKALGRMRDAFGEDADLTTVVESGVQGWIGQLEAQLEAGLDGEISGAATDGIGGLADIADAWRVHLEGGDVIGELIRDADGGSLGIDEQGYLVGEGGDIHVMTLFPNLTDREADTMEPVVDTIRAARDRVTDRMGDTVAVELTGLPSLAVDEIRIIGHTVLVTSAAAGLGVCLLLFILLRSTRQAIMGLVPLTVGLSVTLAVTYFLYGGLNLVTSSFIALLLGLGIDFAVHALGRFNEQLRAGVAPVQSIRDAFRLAGPGIVTGAVTTAMAFLTTSTTEFTAYGELGVLTAVGLTAIMAATFFLLPALVRALAGKGIEPAPEPPAARSVVTIVRRAPRMIVLIGALAALAGAFGMNQIRFDPDYNKFLPAGTESTEGLRRISADPALSPMTGQVAAPSMEDARALADKLEALDAVELVHTPTDFLPVLDEQALAALRRGVGAFPKPPDFEALAQRPVDPEAIRKRLLAVIDLLDEVRFAVKQAGRDTAEVDRAKEAFTRLRERVGKLEELGQARLAATHADVAPIMSRAYGAAKAVADRGGYAPTDLPEVLQRRYVSRDGTELAIFVVPSGDIWDADTARTFVEEVSAVEPSASGLAFNRHFHEIFVVDGFKRAAGYAAIIIVVLLLLDFRRLDDAILALIPTAMGWCWMLGTMVAIDLRFNLANIVALPLVLGIGIDAGVHLVHRARESARANGGITRVEDMVRGTGGAVILSALTTMVGFAGLLAGDYGAARSIGFTMLIGLGACLLASVVVLPALLLALKRAR